GSKKETKLILPFVGSIFLFVLFSNVMGTMPGLTNITYAGKALLRIQTADFSTTFSLAVASLAVIQIMSIRDFGVLGYMGRFIKIHEVYAGFREGFKSGMLSVVNFFVGFLDIIGEIAKVLSISLRLFGNMYAGIVLATVIGGIMAYVLPVFLVAMGLLVAVVQAIVFTSLVTIYYMLAIRSAPEKDY
ncbi:MAG TPA: F0F1 ATP synthase subunit A, partial [Negativicutes bacterium]|nr:F0F1 ATP synthase subunit A [Negativicutes bacterium]